MIPWSTTEILVTTGTAVVVAAAMEPWARLLHGRVWHALLWRVHRSHHEPRLSRFERNDALSVLHAPIAIALVVSGCQLQGLTRAVLIGIGVGMTLFGAGYVLVHDGLVHERLGTLGPFLLRWRLFRRIRGAHLSHHRTGGAPYGLFLGPRELMRVRKRRLRPARAEAPTVPSGSVRAPS